MPLRLAILTVAGVFVAGLPAAHADQARILPFWSQPYPSGFVAADQTQSTPRVARPIVGRMPRMRPRCRCR